MREDICVRKEAYWLSRVSHARRGCHEFGMMYDKVKNEEEGMKEEQDRCERREHTFGYFVFHELGNNTQVITSWEVRG